MPVTDPHTLGYASFGRFDGDHVLLIAKVANLVVLLAAVLSTSRPNPQGCWYVVT